MKRLKPREIHNLEGNRAWTRTYILRAPGAGPVSEESRCHSQGMDGESEVGQRTFSHHELFMGSHMYHVNRDTARCCGRKNHDNPATVIHWIYVICKKKKEKTRSDYGSWSPVWSKMSWPGRINIVPVLLRLAIAEKYNFITMCKSAGKRDLCKMHIYAFLVWNEASV